MSAFSIVMEKEVKNDRFAEGFIETFDMLNQIEKQLLDSYNESIIVLEKHNE